MIIILVRCRLDRQSVVATWNAAISYFHCLSDTSALRKLLSALSLLTLLRHNGTSKFTFRFNCYSAARFLLFERGNHDSLLIGG